MSVLQNTGKALGGIAAAGLIAAAPYGVSAQQVSQERGNPLDFVFSQGGFGKPSAIVMIHSGPVNLLKPDSAAPPLRIAAHAAGLQGPGGMT